MIREFDSKQIIYGENGVAAKDIRGKSTDEKPTVGIATGSTFLEVDTGDVYAFDEDSGEWNKICSLGGGA